MKPGRAELHAVPSPVDGAALLVRCARGDASALGALFDRHHADVYRVLARLRGNAADLDDLVQGTFMGLPVAARGYDPTRPALPFILGVAVNQVRMERRRIFRRLRLWQSHEPDVDLQSEALDPEHAAAAREDLAAFATALRALPEAQREAIVLVEIEGLSGEDAARALGVPVNTLWTRIHYARAALRAAVDRGQR